MITVPFRFDPIDCHTRETVMMALDDLCYMDWLSYLKKHATKIEIEDPRYLAPQHLYEVIFKFHLDPKLETYYTLKYGSYECTMNYTNF